MIEPATTAATGAPTLRVCVVDSPRLGPAYARLAECEGLEVVGKVPWLDPRFLPPELVREAQVVLVGIDADDLRTSDVQTQLIRLARRSSVVAIVADEVDPELAAQIGIRGLVSRAVEPAALVRVVRAVAAGEIAFPRSALARLLQLIGKLPIPLRTTQSSPLTPRQREVIALIAAGATDREVALRLRISESTAHKHVQNALRRSQAKTRSQLVAQVRQDTVSST